ncbi:MAG: YgjV family protein [Clostridia bacterium]|nr:YgjV family protein [Clostridia bacterium]
MVVAHIFGFCGIIVNALIYQQNNRQKLLRTKLLSDILWAIHYASIFAWNGALTCCISTMREIVFMNKEKKWAKSKLWLVFFILCAIISAILTWNGIISIFPTIASVVSVFMFWIGDPRLTRLCQLPISSGFLLYNVYCMSYMGIVNECFSLLSIIMVLIIKKPST